MRRSIRRRISAGSYVLAVFLSILALVATKGAEEPSSPPNEDRPATASDSGVRGHQKTSGIGFGRFQSDDAPIRSPIAVDYRDDKALRLRRAGLLRGPLPMPSGAAGGVATSGCTFNIECDDGNPCTIDHCNYTPGMPVGSGTCVNSPAPDGSDGAFGDATCAAQAGLLCGGCDDGVFCNGIETCQGGICTAGTPPCTGSQVCSETLDFCQPAACSTQKKCIGGTTPGTYCTINSDCPTGGVCTSGHCVDGPTPGANCATGADCIGDVRCAYADCDDLVHCNGDETCVAGVCVAGTRPCGSNALCGERKCKLIAGQASEFPAFCTSNNDCFVEGAFGTCTTEGPVCLEGRCCTSNATDPVCERRMECDDAGGGSCIASSCDTAGGLFYGGDQGTIPEASGGGCPIVGDVPMRCPKYSSGIAPFGLVAQLVGPVSDSPVANPLTNVPLHKLGTV